MGTGDGRRKDTAIGPLAGGGAMISVTAWRERQEQRRRALEAALPAVVAQLREMGALRIILFGSLARGEAGPRSDLDLIALLPAAHSSREWMRRVYAEVDRKIACDILAYSEQEFPDVLAHSRFLRQAVREGKVLYEA